MAKTSKSGKKTEAEAEAEAEAKDKGKSKQEPAVEIIAILDRSGSMKSSQEEVINSYNKYIEKQKALPGSAKVSLTIFDDEITPVYSGVDVKSAPILDDSVYFTRGMTALNDAVGKTLSAASSRLKKEKHVLVCIITDGQENSSKEYKAPQIKKMVASLEKRGWEFAFIGAGIDAFAEGSAIGVSASTARGTPGIYFAQSAMCAMAEFSDHAVSYRRDMTEPKGKKSNDDVRDG